jgi:hypothetical protein
LPLQEDSMHKKIKKQNSINLHYSIARGVSYESKSIDQENVPQM